MFVIIEKRYERRTKRYCLRDQREEIRYTREERMCDKRR